MAYAAPRASLGPVYDDFVPPHFLIAGDGTDTLLIELPGFKKEQIKVQIDNFGRLRISGQRQITENRWSRFRKDYLVEDNCNASGIRAMFEDGRLYIDLPKLIYKESARDETPKAPEPTVDAKVATEDKTGGSKDDNTQQKTSSATAPGEKKMEQTDPTPDDKKKMEQVDPRKETHEAEKEEKEQTEEFSKDKDDDKDAAMVDAGKKETLASAKAAPELVARFEFYRPTKMILFKLVMTVFFVGVLWHIISGGQTVSRIIELFILVLEKLINYIPVD